MKEEGRLMVIESPIPTRIVLAMLLPSRIYLRWFPLKRGKGIVLNRLVRPILCRLPGRLRYELPGGTLVSLPLQEAPAQSVWLYGHYEPVEQKYLHRSARPGDVVIDIGANVGVFTILLAEAVGERGQVWAFEPLENNRRQLRDNLQLNDLTNATIFECALGNRTGEAQMTVPRDSAFASISKEMNGTAACHRVSIRRLDSVWNECGRPSISLIKLDVEGAEAEVLEGSHELLDTCKPVLMLEANSEAALSAIEEFLAARGYIRYHPDGFRSYNHVFLQRGSAET